MKMLPIITKSRTSTDKILSDKSKGKEHPNDDYDKGIDTILGYSVDED